MEVKTHNKNFNVPNALSALRILLIPFFAYYFLIDEIITSVILILVSGLSDAVDGYIARKFNQITELGKILDPFADKLTQITLALCIGIKFPFLLPLLGIFMLKETAMVIMASGLIKKKKKPCAAKWYGKVSTILFYMSVTAIVVMYQTGVDKMIFDTVSYILLGLTAILMVYSAVKYFEVYREIVSSDDENHFNLKEELHAKKEKN